MNLRLNGKRAVVCGSTQGIGKAVALEIAQMGAHVTLIARNESKLKDVLGLLSNDGTQKHDFICSDFSNPADLKNKIDSFAKENIAEILINNTGGPAGGPALSAELDEYRQAFESHLICNQILAVALVPGMKKKGFGRIVNIISTSVKSPINGLGVSNTIRAAVANWSKTLSVELASHGITVNNVLPGATNTERLSYIIEQKASKSGRTYKDVEQDMKNQVPASRFASPEEIAAAVAFLASESAAYINGINVPVDGGRTACL